MAVYKGVVPSGKYTFNAATKTIVFDSDYNGIALSDIMLITNVKSGTAVTIYDPFDTTKGGTLSILTLTLNYDTTAMSNTDPLQIIVGMTSLPTALPSDAATETTLSTLNGKIPSGLTVSSTRLLVDGTGGSFPVSGTITANAGSGTMNVSVQNASLAVTGPLTDAQLRASAVPVSLAAGSNTVGSINNISGTISLPTGAATETTLSTLNNKVPSLGQALAAGSVPVVLTASQLSTLTPLSSVSVSNFPATQPVSGTVSANISGSISNTAFGVNNGSGASAVNIQDGGNSITVDGTVTANAGTGNFTVVQATAANLNATVTGTVAATQSGTWNVGQVAVTSGGVIPSSGSSVGGTSAITLYSSPGQVYGWYFYNPNGNAAYIHFYDTAAAITVGGSPTPYYVLVIPPLTGANVFGIGITHTNSIKIGISAGRSSGTPMSTAIDYTIFYK